MAVCPNVASTDWTLHAQHDAAHTVFATLGPRLSDDLSLTEFLVTGAVAFFALAVVLALLPNDEKDGTSRSEETTVEGDGGLPFARDDC